MKKDLLAGIFKYPFFYLVLFCLVFAHLFLSIWFAAGFLANLIFVLADFVLLLVFVFFCLGSVEYRTFLDSTGKDENRRQLYSYLNKTPVGFGKMFREAVELIDQIKNDFQSDASRYELDFLLANLETLCKDTAELHDRSKKYGNDDQKKIMRDILLKNDHQLSTALTSLKTLSGNLTLINSTSDSTDGISDELKAINQGLSEALEAIKYEN